MIGAGAAGLVAARECLRQGFRVRVFEKSGQVGGVWQYTDDVEDDLLGVSSQRPLHGSLYKSLRTNLPVKLMAFRDFPFEPGEGESQFVSHERVQSYLENFAKVFDLYPVVRFGTTVDAVKSLSGDRWLVRTSDSRESVFDAVIVGNGHYSKPRVPGVEGMKSFKGLLMHSHNYRNSDRFKGKRVALFGAAASALDISLEISQVAEQVYWCAEKHSDIDVGPHIKRVGSPLEMKGSDLQVKGQDRVNHLDAFIFCTGYHYDFPFLENGIVNVVDNWVHPLYREIIPPHHPTIAFIGLSYAVIPFPLFEIQVKWFTRMLARKFNLPSQSNMVSWCEKKASWLRANKPKQRNFHKKGPELYSQMDDLAEECGAKSLPEWFVPLAERVRLARLEYPVSYRDHECWKSVDS